MTTHITPRHDTRSAFPRAGSRLAAMLEQVGAPVDTRTILIYELYHHLQFTLDLEYRYIVPAIGRLLCGPHRYSVGRRLERALVAVARDETCHAQSAYSLLYSIEARTGIAPLAYERSLDRGLMEADVDLSDEERAVLLAVVSETLLSETLASGAAQGNANLYDDVESFLALHLRDEMSHARIFSQVLRHWVRELPTVDRHRIGVSVPVIARIYFSPPLCYYEEVMRLVGVAADEAMEVIRQLEIQRFDGISQLAGTTRAVVAAGLLDVPGVAEAFRQYGLERLV